MAAHGLPVSIAGVAQAYKEFLDILVVDHRDAKAAETLQKSGLRVQCANTIMSTLTIKLISPARSCLCFLPRDFPPRDLPPRALRRKRSPRRLGSPMILVPVKNLASAKQRLAAILDQPTRTELAQVMLLDVLETLANWPDHPDVGIVTSDPFALQLARQFHFTVIADHANRGETDAIETATRFCEAARNSTALW